MKSDKFKSFVAVMVAVVTVLGALTACLASVAVSEASDMDFAGVDALIRGQRAEIINYVNAYEEYRAFTSYRRYLQLGYYLEQPDEVWGIASGISFYFFKPRYINPEDRSEYDLERQLQEAWADDAQSEDLNSTPYFLESDVERGRSSFLTGNMIVFALAFWFFTVAQTTEKKIKYFWAGLGVLFGLFGIIGIVIGRYFL